MPQPQRLAPDQVQYLSLEGGGGKGAAYLGALAALAHPSIGLLVHDHQRDDYFLKRDVDGEGGIKGIAGASAGAITAALLASGWGLRALRRDVISDRRTLQGFFDIARLGRRRVPVLEDRLFGPAPGSGGPPLMSPTSCRTERGETAVQQFLTTTIRGSAVMWALRRLLRRYTSDPALQRVHGDLIRKVDRHMEAYIVNLFADYGVFSGCDARATINDWIARGQYMGSPGVSLGFNVPFSLHRQLSGLELVLTGTNLTTASGAYFSDRHGLGRMPVADAVRISMGIPVAFKPVYVPNRAFGGLEAGYWVDGGVLNNNPIHAFDAAGSGGQINRHVLGLRLEEDRANRIENLGHYLLAVANTYMNAAETREIRTPQEAAQTVQLPVPPNTLSLLNFTPDDAALWRANRASARAMLRYFGVNDSPDPLLRQVLGLRAPATP
jgi:NTE family protein